VSAERQFARRIDTHKEWVPDTEVSSEGTETRISILSLPSNLVAHILEYDLRYRVEFLSSGPIGLPDCLYEARGCRPGAFCSAFRSALFVRHSEMGQNVGRWSLGRIGCWTLGLSWPLSPFVPPLPIFACRLVPLLPPFMKRILHSGIKRCRFYSRDNRRSQHVHRSQIDA
jgi:hypothetical protein